MLQWKRSESSWPIAVRSLVFRMRNGTSDLYFELQKVVDQGHIRIVEHLLSLNIHGRDEDVVVDAMDDDDQTALAVAAEFGNMEIVRQLLEAGADRDRCSMEGRTPLSRAREKSHADIVAILER